VTETFQTAATAAAASPYDADAISVVEAASPERLPLRPNGAQPPARVIAFTAPPATSVRSGPERITVGTTLQAGRPTRERTYDERLRDWLELLADLERQFGPIPNDVRAEVRREWRD
jgi:hypothetical protein